MYLFGIGISITDSQHLSGLELASFDSGRQTAFSFSGIEFCNVRFINFRYYSTISESHVSVFFHKHLNIDAMIPKRN